MWIEEELTWKKRRMDKMKAKTESKDGEDKKKERWIEKNKLRIDGGHGIRTGRS